MGDLLYKNLTPRMTFGDGTSAASVAVPVPRVRRFAPKRVLKTAAKIVLITAIASAGWFGWKFYSDIAKATGDKNPLQLLSVFTPADLKETNGRVNVLLAGYSDDDPGHQGADLTDSIMILSVDPSTKQADVISVPRDLYVDIPGFGYSKINAAYEYGQQENFSESGYASGGMGLLEKTITDDFGVQFGYYALINYTAFKDAVDAVGGVTVNIQSSDPRGLYDPNTNLNLPNGSVALNGQTALNLARARGDGYGSYGFPQGDFNRTQHQQQILLALKDKASQTSVIANPLKIGSLADALGNNVKTDMKVNELETLYADLKGVSDSNIKTINLNSFNGQDLLASSTSDDGEDILIPAAGLGDYDDIQAAMNSLLAPPSSTANQ